MQSYDAKITKNLHDSSNNPKQQEEGSKTRIFSHRVENIKLDHSKIVAYCEDKRPWSQNLTS